MKLIPDTPKDIDIEWLSSALVEKFPGVSIANLEIERSLQATNCHVHLKVEYREAAGAPKKMFCKFLPSDPARKELIANTHMGLREAQFYKELAPSIDMRIPDVYCVRFDEKDDSFVLLMEQITSSGCTVSDGKQTVSVDSAAQALEDLAKLHLQFESSDVRRARIPWLTEQIFDVSSENNYGPSMLGYGLENHCDRLSPGFIELSKIYIERHAQLHKLWAEGPQTLIHGDLHIGNLFDDHGRTGFLDWGIISIGTPLRDLSFFLIMSLSTEDRRNHQRDLIKHYLDVRKAGKGFLINFDDAWRGYQLHAAYGAPACCQIVTFPEDATDQRKVFANAFLARAEEAIDDLDVVDGIMSLCGISQ